MTAPTATTASSAHTQPALATACGLAVGVLTLAATYFGTGHLPTAADVAAVIAGSGVSLGSVVAFVAHHLGVLKLTTPTITPTTTPTTTTPTAPPEAPTT